MLYKKENVFITGYSAIFKLIIIHQVNMLPISAYADGIECKLHQESICSCFLFMYSMTTLNMSMFAPDKASAIAFRGPC